METTVAELEENLKLLRERTSFQRGGEGGGEGEGPPVLRIPPVIVPVSLVRVRIREINHTHATPTLGIVYTLYVQLC